MTLNEHHERWVRDQMFFYKRGALVLYKEKVK